MNNDQINNTSYYALPCGRQLEDYIDGRKLGFAFGSAMKYRFRAGKKDGESADKDLAKFEHFVRFLSATHHGTVQAWKDAVDEEIERANKWDGQ